MINADIKLDEFNENDKKAIDPIYKKYELLLDDTIEVDGKTLYRIRSTSNFVSNNLFPIYVDTLGGYVESRHNLSDDGTCWIDYDSKVYGDAIIRDNALIVKSNINGNAECLSSNIALNSFVQDSTLVGYFEVWDSSIVKSNITSSYINDSRVSRSTVKNATVRSSLITDAWVDGEEDSDNDVLSSARSVSISKSEVYGIVEGYDSIIYTIVPSTTDTSKDIFESIRIQTGLIPYKEADGKYYVIAYKQVAKDMCSFYDREFKYTVGEYAVVENCDESNEPCASGLHFSNANYWVFNQSAPSSIFLTAKICLDDIIAVSRGKIRCRKAFIMDAYTLKETRL